MKKSCLSLAPRTALITVLSTALIAAPFTQAMAKSQFDQLNQLDTNAPIQLAQFNAQDLMKKLPGGDKKGADPVAAAGGCAAGAVALAATATQLAKKDGARQNLTPDQIKARERSYLLGYVVGGCALGSLVSSKVVGSLTESNKQAISKATEQAAKQSGPVELGDASDPSFRVRAQRVGEPEKEGGKTCVTIEQQIIKKIDAAGQPEKETVYTQSCTA